MRLSELSEEQLLSIADNDFQETIQSEAKSLSQQAMNTYQEVMLSSDDDKARVQAADKILSLAGFQEKQSSSLPSGVSEEVFKLALAGLGQLAGIAQSSGMPQILRNVTPEKTDPRPMFETSIDNSPMNRKTLIENEDSSEDNHIIKERYEIIERKRIPDEN